MDERNPLPGRITHRLNLDSEEEKQRQQQARLEREQYERQKQQKRKRKQQKRREKQQQERLAKLQAQRKVQQRKKQVQKYNDPAILFTPDSDSGVSFSRIKRKIQQKYPKYAKKKQKDQSSESQQSQGQQQEQQSQDQSQSQSEQSSGQQQSQSHKKRQKKVKKNDRPEKRKRNHSDSQQNQNKKKNKAVVKLQPEMSGKDKLVQDVAVRWSYALPEWPPLDYNYQAELKKRGYRAVQFSKFKFVDQVVEGLVKVYELDGYRGVYRGKLGLIDVRPKENCPSLNYFYSKSQQELNDILKRALAQQIQLLQQIQFKQSGQEKLLQDLKRKLKQVSKLIL